jgi:ribose transport system ATP-binding protein
MAMTRNRRIELLRLEGVCKSFPGVLALRNVDFSLYTSEVHALLGENGAGKSTLIKIISGVYGLDAGNLYVYGRKFVIANPRQAQRIGISTIYQELDLALDLTVAENITLGTSPTRHSLPGFVDREAMRTQAQAILNRLQISIELNALVSDLPPAQRRMVAIAKALAVKSRIFIIDEPTAALSEREITALFKIIENLKAQGVGTIYISHRLEEAKRVADRATILRNGEKVTTVPIRDVTINDLIRLMVGRDVREQFPKKKAVIGKELLRVDKLTRQGVFQDVSFSVNQGEIVGLSGLVGAGRSEVARTIFGADRADMGKIYFLNREVNFKSPEEAINRGVGFVPEERKEQGILLSFSIRKNITLPILKGLTRFGFLNFHQEKIISNEYINRLQIKAISGESIVEYLSGGNQQKVVLAKWLCSCAKLFLFDEPTRGIDVGAKVEVYELMNNLVQEGGGILLISSELPEIMGMSDRILVLDRQGKLSAVFDRSEATEEKVLAAAFGHSQAYRHVGDGL